MTNLSVDQAFLRAQSHIKRNEIEEAKKLYQAVLIAFPKNNQGRDVMIDAPSELDSSQISELGINLKKN